MRLFAGDDWAHDHHDVEVMGETGRVLATARLPGRSNPNWPHCSRYGLMPAGNGSPLGSRCVCALSECVAHRRVPWCTSPQSVICAVNGLADSGLREAGWLAGACPGAAWFIGPRADRGTSW